MNEVQSIGIKTPYQFNYILLSKTKYALVDSEDYKYLMQFHWQAKKSKVCWYAVRKLTIHGKTHYIKMHREITRAPPGTHVHHKNHNSLDNRRSNLYVCSPTDHKLLH